MFCSRGPFVCVTKTNSCCPHSLLKALLSVQWRHTAVFTIWIRTRRAAIHCCPEWLNDGNYTVRSQWDETGRERVTLCCYWRTAVVTVSCWNRQCAVLWNKLKAWVINLFTAPPLHCVPLYAGSGCCTGAYRHCLANTGMVGLYGTRFGVQRTCAFCIALTAECSQRGTACCHNICVTAAVQLYSFLPLALGAVSPLGPKRPVEWKAVWAQNPM